MAKIDIGYLTREADKIWRDVRWKDGIHCPECSCEDYYQLSDGRYKCKRCGKIFSDVSGTLLHHSKVEKWKWLYAIWKMSNAKGVSNIELSKDICVNVKTAWMMQQKVRYAISQEGLTLSGVIAMDEAHIGGWSGMHFDKKWKYLKDNHFIDANGNWYNKKDILAASSKKKHHIVSMVGQDKSTVIMHLPPITKGIVKQVLDQHTNGIELLVTDESKLYQNLRGIAVEQSCHSKGIFMTTGSHSSNACENRFSWVKRKVNGIYTHTSKKYLQLYLNQMAWSNNHMDEKPDDRFKALLYTCTCTYVRSKDVLTYEPFQGITYEDYYEKELKEAKEIMDRCSIIQAVETKHKVKIQR